MNHDPQELAVKRHTEKKSEGIMRRSLTGLLLFVCFGFTSAQDEQLVSGKIESGGFGAPVWKITQLNGETAFLSGGRGGWIINHTFVIGGGGYSTIGDVKTDLVNLANNEPLYLRMEYSGLELEYIHHSGKLVHWTAQTLFGGGRLEIREHDPDRTFAKDDFAVVDASLNAEINVLKWMRVNAGAGYRLVFGVNRDFSNGDIGGIEAQVAVKFGSF
jgi:hypothetical protein